MNDTIFKASIDIITLMETELLPLRVDLKLGVNLENVDSYHQAITLERIRYLVNIMLNNSIFANRNNKLIEKLKESTSTRIAECWDEPWDLSLALMIYYKVSAVMEGKGYIDFINISGDHVSSDLEYTYYSDILNAVEIDADMPYMRDNNLSSLWYHRPDTSIDESDAFESDWDSVGLPWNKPVNKEENDVPIYKNNIKPFIPQIIK